MKNYLFLLVLVPGLSAAQTPISFVLKGRLGITTYRGKPTYVYLRSGMMFDSAVVKKGQFELKGTVDEPTKAYLSMSRHNEDMSDHKAVFWLEPGTLVFTSPDSLKNAHVGGTPLTDAWQELWASHEPIDKQLYALKKSLRPRRRRTSSLQHSGSACRHGARHWSGNAPAWIRHSSAPTLPRSSA
jgi:hypothetical protein